MGKLAVDVSKATENVPFSGKWQIWLFSDMPSLYYVKHVVPILHCWLSQPMVLCPSKLGKRILYAKKNAGCSRPSFFCYSLSVYQTIISNTEFAGRLGTPSSSLS